MKKFLVCCLLAVNIFFISCDSPKKHWENALEKFNNKDYVEAENILNNLVAKYPTSEFAEKAKEKTVEIYWNRAIDKFSDKKYEESENILNTIIERNSNSNFAEKAKEKITEINLIKNKIKAKNIIAAIKNNKGNIINGTTTMLQVVIDTIGEPVKTFEDNTHNILLYGDEAKDASNDNLQDVSFVVKVPILGAKSIKSLSATLNSGKKINKGIAKVVCAEISRIEKETEEELMYAMSGGYGYYGGSAGYQIGSDIANRMTRKLEKVISYDHIFNLQFERLQILSYDKKIV